MTIRVIARLDVKPPNLVKGVHLEGFRVMGNPSEFAKNYFESGADEISYQDVVASLYSRNSIGDIVKEAANGIFVPLSVGGGIRTVEDMRALLRCGADKVLVNTAAIREPVLVSHGAAAFGSQAMVVAVEAKRLGSGWTALTDSGREHTHLDVLEWIRRLADLGAGEILLTSIDRDGTKRGMDLELIEAARSQTDLPLIAHGGVGSPKDVVDAARAGADAVALASALHYGLSSIADVKQALRDNGFEAREWQ